MIVVVVAEEAELLHRAARDALEPRAVVDVCDVHRAGLLREVAAVRNDRRTLPRLERDCLAVEPVLALGNAHHVVVDVDEVKPDKRVRRGLHAREVVLFAQRIRVQEIGLAARELVHRVRIGHVALDVLAVAREFMHHAGLLLREDLGGDAQRVLGRPPVAVRRVVLERVGARKRRVEHEEAPHLGAVVVPPADHRDLVGVARNRARAVEERRHEGIGAPHGELADAVGIHRHQDARPVVRLVGIFPAGVEDASVVRDCRRVVGVLFVGELADLAGLAVDTIGDGHRQVTVLAGEELVGRRAKHHDLVLVRQVAGVPPLDIVLSVFGRNELRLLIGHILRQLREVCGDFIDSEEVVRPLVTREEDARGVEVEIDVTHDRGLVRRLVERRELGLAAQIAQHADFVLETRTGGHHVVLGVESGHAAAASAEGAARTIDLAVDTEDLVKVENRVREHGGAVPFDELHRLGLLRVRPLLKRRLRVVQLRNKRLNGRIVLRIVVLRIRLQVGHRAAGSRGREPCELLLGGASGSDLFGRRGQHGKHGERKRKREHASLHVRSSFSSSSSFSRWEGPTPSAPTRSGTRCDSSYRAPRCCRHSRSHRRPPLRGNVPRGSRCGCRSPARH